MKKWSIVGNAIAAALALTLAGVVTGVATASSPAAGTVAPPKPPQQAFDLHSNQSSEAQFVPLKPCRMVDTRVAGGMLGGTVRQFKARGSDNFAAQGGPGTGCGIPLAAVAVTAAVTTVKGASDGYLNLWPADEAEPSTSLVSYFASKAMTTTTSITLAHYDSGDFAVHNHGTSTHVVLDALGYYIVPTVASIRPDGSIYAGTNRVLTSHRTGAGEYTVNLDHNVGLCTPTVSVYERGHYAQVATYSASVVQISVWKIANGVTVPVDDYVLMAVVC